MSTGQNNVHSAFTDTFTQIILNKATNLEKLEVLYCLHIKAFPLFSLNPKMCRLLEFSLIKIYKCEYDLKILGAVLSHEIGRHICKFDKIKGGYLGEI